MHKKKHIKYTFEYINLKQKGGDNNKVGFIKLLEDNNIIVHDNIKNKNLKDMITHYNSDNSLPDNIKKFIQRILYPIYIICNINLHDITPSQNQTDYINLHDITPSQNQTDYINYLYGLSNPPDVHSVLSKLGDKLDYMSNRYFAILFRYRLSNKYDYVIKNLEQIINENNKLKDTYFEQVTSNIDQKITIWINNNKLAYPPQIKGNNFNIVSMKEYFLQYYKKTPTLKHLNYYLIYYLLNASVEDIIDKINNDINDDKITKKDSPERITSKEVKPFNSLEYHDNSCFLDSIVYFLFRMTPIKNKIISTKDILYQNDNHVKLLVDAFNIISGNNRQKINFDICPIEGWEKGTQEDADAFLKTFINKLEIILYDDISFGEYKYNSTINKIEKLRIFSIEVYDIDIEKYINNLSTYDNEKVLFNLHNTKYLMVLVNNEKIKLANKDGHITINSFNDINNSNADNYFNDNPKSKNIQYELIGIILRTTMKQVNIGHYICFLKYDNKWYEYDDQNNDLEKVIQNSSYDNIMNTGTYNNSSSEKYYARILLYQQKIIKL